MSHDCNHYLCEKHLYSHWLSRRNVIHMSSAWLLLSTGIALWVAWLEGTEICPCHWAWRRINSWSIHCSQRSPIKPSSESPAGRQLSMFKFLVIMDYHAGWHDKIKKLLYTSVSSLVVCVWLFYGWVVVGHQLCQMNAVRSLAWWPPLDSLEPCKFLLISMVGGY